jgi:hypothetical protein
MTEHLPREALTPDEHLDLLTGGSERSILESTFNMPTEQGTWRVCAFCPSQATRPYYATGNADVVFVCGECYEGLMFEKAARESERY